MDVDVLRNLILAYAGRIVLAGVVLLVGWYLIKQLVVYVQKRLEKSSLDASLNAFLTSLIKAALLIILIITVASMVGLEVTSLIAVLAAASFAVGLALQGSLANFAGGVLLLLLKPFRVGDYIEAVGYAGTVQEIQIFYTVLHSPDNKKIIIPNANLSNNSTVNYTANETRRIDFKFGVGYGDDLQKVKEVLLGLAQEHPLIFSDPPPQVVLGEHGDSAIIFLFRVWCKTADYWSIYFELQEKVKLRFDEAGINIPYPQVDVHFPAGTPAAQQPPA